MGIGAMTNSGILHQMWAVPGISDRQCILDAADDVRLAEELGFESFWFGEHHFNREKMFFGRVPVPELLIARLAATTRQIRLGTGIKVLPLDSAARFAEKMALLDLLTDRRAVFGIGEGTRGPLVSEDTKGLRYREELAELIAYLRGDTTDGRPALTPAPERDLTRLLWAAVRNFESLRASARHGINLALGQLGNSQFQRTFVDVYRDAGGAGEVRAFRLAVVAETDAEAAALKHAAAEVYPAMRRGDASDPSNDTFIICGSPSTAAEQILQFKAECDVDRVDLLAHIPGVSHEVVQQTLRLYAHEVAPLVGVTMLAPVPEAVSA
jgi:alkanesulfonate monooxygenase SsuD/methylene tetrahydromethanopterin reductase-like flavin-dependent oxidoreductase (luciferase family)